MAEEIDIKRIMKEIRKKIKKEEQLDYLITGRILEKRNISSHRKFTGKFLVKIREFLDDEIQRSIEPTVINQEKINRTLLNEIKDLKRKIKKLEK